MTIKDISYFARQERVAGNESGRSLVEMLGTIGIITMITVGAIVGSRTGMTMWKASQTHEQVMELIQGITDLYSWQRDGWGGEDFNNLAQLCEDGRFSFCDAGNNMQFALGSNISVVGDDEGEGEVLTITVEGIPYQAALFLRNKADGHIITSVRCDKCDDGSRGLKTLEFKYDVSDVEQ